MYLGINSNINNSNPSFGMLKISADAKERIAEKITSKNSIKKLENLANSQQNNPFKVFIDSEGNGFTAYIADTTPKNKSRSFLTVQGMFESTISFIERVCKFADKQNDNIYKPDMKKRLKQILENIQEG